MTMKNGRVKVPVITAHISTVILPEVLCENDKFFGMHWASFLFWFGCGWQQKRHVAAPPPCRGAEENGKKQAETGGSG